MCFAISKSLGWLCTLALFIAAGGCTKQISNVPTGERMGHEASSAVIEPNRQTARVPKEPQHSLTEHGVAARSAPLRATTVNSAKTQKTAAMGQAARVTSVATSAVPEIQEIASPQTNAAGILPGPGESQAITGLSGAWSAVFVLAMVATLLLVTRLIGRRSVPTLPEDKPLAKLLHTRPWR